MIVHECKDAIVYVCTNCIPKNGLFPRQWIQGNLHVQVKELPCSGKINTQYIFHVLEGGASGLCIVTCPKGDCHLSQGNYRAEMRVNNVKKLLAEIGMNPDKVKIVQFSKNESGQSFEEFIRNAINQFSLKEPEHILLKN